MLKTQKNNSFLLSTTYTKAENDHNFALKVWYIDLSVFESMHLTKLVLLSWKFRQRMGV